RYHVQFNSITHLISRIPTLGRLILHMQEIFIYQTDSFTIYLKTEIYFTIIIRIVWLTRYFIPLIDGKRGIYNLIIEKGKWHDHIFIGIIPIIKIGVFPVLII